MGDIVDGYVGLCMIIDSWWQVYINGANVDEYLVNSIVRPADDPNAGEVYYRY